MYHIFLISLIASVSSSVVYRSSCPPVQAIENFNITGVANGLWHEIGRYPYEIEKATSCVTYLTKPHGTGFTTESVNISSNSIEYVSGSCEIIPSDNGRGLLNFTLSSGGSPRKSIHIPVVNALYENDDYFFVYSCVHDEIKGMYKELAWIFSRDPLLLSSDAKKDLYKNIESIGFLDVSKFIWIDHSNC